MASWRDPSGTPHARVGLDAQARDGVEPLPRSGRAAQSTPGRDAGRVIVLDQRSRTGRPVAAAALLTTSESDGWHDDGDGPRLTRSSTSAPSRMRDVAGEMRVRPRRQVWGWSSCAGPRVAAPGLEGPHPRRGCFAAGGGSDRSGHEIAEFGPSRRRHRGSGGGRVGGRRLGRTAWPTDLVSSRRPGLTEVRAFPVRMKAVP